MGSKGKAKKLKQDSGVKKSSTIDKEEAEEHAKTLQKLQEKDPEFYEFLKEHNNELLEFDEDIDDDNETEAEENEGDFEHPDGEAEKEEKTITSAMVDSWVEEIRNGKRVRPVRSLLRAYRTACHYGDDSGDNPEAKFSTMSSSVFNKVMVVVLTEMDGILRGLLDLPASGGKKETIMNLMMTRRWKKNNHLVKSYLGNSLHVLNQMTDDKMIAFMLERLRHSSVFLAAFPALLRKYVKVALHFWGTGNDALTGVSFLFLQVSCVRLGSDCLDECIKGMYKAYVLNCHFINATKLQHIELLSNCFVQLLKVDVPSAYQRAFVYIRQLAGILREAFTGSGKSKIKKDKAPSKSNKTKGKEASSTRKKETFRKVYQWKFINCLELWTKVICENSSDPDMIALAYPLTQIITGTAQLLPSASYFPLRLRCVRMLNRISASTNTYVPVSLLLLDMLSMKELRSNPTGGVGKAVDMLSTLKVNKATLKSKAFHEACVSYVIEELTEHLAQWSYSIAFSEFSHVPSIRLRNLCKSTKVDRFRREFQNLVRQIDANSDFINQKRSAITILPNDPAAATFLKDEKHTSPLSKFVVLLRKRAKERSDALKATSILVGDGSSRFGHGESEDDEDDEEDYDGSENDENPDLFSPRRETKSNPKKVVEKKENKVSVEDADDGEDIVEDFVLSSDEDDELVNDILNEEDSDSEAAAPAQNGKKQNPSSEPKARNRKSKSKKRKRSGKR